MKSEVDKLDVDMLVPVPVDLCKLSDVVKNDFEKRLNMMNWLTLFRMGGGAKKAPLPVFPL